MDEKKAKEIYTKMAEAADSEENVKIFQNLAEMENGHKNKLEVLYEEIFYEEF